MNDWDYEVAIAKQLGYNELERGAHNAEVPGSSPCVPTKSRAMARIRPEQKRRGEVMDSRMFDRFYRDIFNNPKSVRRKE